jgi:hypothetical protein
MSCDSTHEDDSEAAGWIRESRQLVYGQVTQIESQAQSWVGVISTLLGLFSAVVVIGRGTAINELPVGIVWRGVVFTFAVITYGLAFIAVVYGLWATWGGLGQHLSAKGEAKTQKRSGRPGQLENWFMHLWRPQSQSEQLKRGLSNEYWHEYMDKQLDLADELRKPLYRSRLLGVAAVVLAGLLAITVLGFSTFAQSAQAPTLVVVVHDGQMTCGPIHVGADGQTQVSGRVIPETTQVVVVSHC